MTVVDEALLRGAIRAAARMRVSRAELMAETGADEEIILSLEAELGVNLTGPAPLVALGE